MELKRKRLLFILPTGDIGGTRTALINLISNMDRQRYDIDVLLMLRRGPVTAQLEQLCTVLPQNKMLKSGRGSGAVLAKAFDIASLIRRVCISLRAKLNKTDRFDMAYRLAARQYSNRYDCVIAYQEKDATEFAQYITAPRRIAWVHSAYQGHAEQLRPIYDRFDRVVFVSDGIMKGYLDTGAVDSDRSIRIYNNLDLENPRALSNEYTVERKRTDCPMLVSVGRCAKEKRFDRIINAAARLKNNGVNFEWYIVGGGTLLDELTAAAEQAGVNDRVFFVGQKANPYPYIKQADAVVVSSQVESFSLICVEAAALQKPVVVTDYPAAHEVVADGKTGIICPNSTDGVYEGTNRILCDAQLRARICNDLALYCYDNSAIIDQVYAVIDATE